jgi:D-sedoheptulose 7-phosphate isomerase
MQPMARTISVSEYLTLVSDLVAAMPVDVVERQAQRILRAYRERKKLLLVGNGGSSSTASHLANDFQKCVYLEGGRPFACMALTDSVPLITAWANDADYSRVFAEQVRAWAGPGDVLICISGSGNSPNVLEAADVGREQGATVLGWAGFEGGRLKERVDDCLVVPSDNMQRIEDVHMVVGHAVFTRVRDMAAAERVG